MRASPSTANRYMHKHGLISPKLSNKNILAWKHKKQREGLEESEPSLKVKHRPPKLLKDYAPGALIEKDMKFVLKVGKFSNTEKYRAKENFNYQHTEIDSFTRIRTIELVETSDSKIARATHKVARERFPFSVASYNTDNGGENEKEFARSRINIKPALRNKKNG